MEEHAGRVQKRIREKASLAYNVHCYGHRLNLVLINVVKHVPQAAEFFSLLEELTGLKFQIL